MLRLRLPPSLMRALTFATGWASASSLNNLRCYRPFTVPLVPFNPPAIPLLCFTHRKRRAAAMTKLFK